MRPGSPGARWGCDRDPQPQGPAAPRASRTPAHPWLRPQPSPAPPQCQELQQDTATAPGLSPQPQEPRGSARGHSPTTRSLPGHPYTHGCAACLPKPPPPQTPLPAAPIP